MTQYDLNLREYWRIIKKRKFVVIITALVLCVFSTFSAIIQAPDPLYTSTCSIRFEKETTLEGLYARTLSWSEGDDIETQLAIITGYPVMTEVAKNMSLIPKEGSIDDPNMNSIVEGLKSKVSVDREEYTNIINISVVDRNPLFAQKMANEVAEAYKKIHSDQQGKRTKEALKYIDDQLNNVRGKLRKSEEDFNRFSQVNQILSIDMQSENLLIRKKEIKDEIRELNEDKSELNILLSRIKKFLKAPSSSEIDTNFYSATATQQYQNTNNSLVELLLKRDTLLENYTEQYPEVISARQKIVENGRKMALLLNQQLGIIEQKKKDLDKELEELNYLTNNLMEKKLEYDRLKRELDSFRDMTALLEQKNQEALIRQAEKPEEVVILRKAMPSGSAINPPKVLSTGIMGIIIGIVLGLIVAFIIETFDTSLGAIEDVEETLGAKVLGVLPFTDEKEVLEGIRNGHAKEPDDHTLRKYISLVSHFAPKTMIAESFRALRTNIQFAGETENAKTLSITSTSPQEGKSMVSINLSISMAQAGLKTLLVGADLRKPMMSKIFGLEESPGLTDILLGSYPWKDTVRTVTDIIMGRMSMDDVMLTPGMDNLNIITCGGIPPNPAELIDSKRLDEFIEEAKKEYDIIIFDSTPVLSTADAAILGKKVDGVLIVYRIGSVSKGLLKRTSIQLDQVNCNVLGVVLNGMKPDISPDFPGYKYYQYYSYYGEGETGEEKESKGILSFLSGLIGKGIDPRSDEVSTARKVKKKKGKSFPKFLIAGIALVFIAVGILWQSGVIDPFSASNREIRDGNGNSKSVKTQPGPTPYKDEKKPAVQAAVKAPAADENMPLEEEKSETEEISIEPVIEEVKVEREKPEYPSGSFPYSIYFGSFKTKEKAENAIDIYTGKGLSPYRVRVDFKEKGIWYRVYSGHFGKPEEAEFVINSKDLKDASIKKTEFASLVEVYMDEDNMEDNLILIEEKGYSPYVIEFNNGNYALFVGAFIGNEAAENFNTDLLSEGIQSRVVGR
ncbi:SPOR domain-containing protein [Thermodesulfobacteriota bacterium]